MTDNESMSVETKPIVINKDEPEKGDSVHQEDILTSSLQSNTLDDMQREMKNVLSYFEVDYTKFKPEIAFKKLNDYLKQNDRLLYSTISNFVYANTGTQVAGKKTPGQESVMRVLSNLEKLVDYVDVPGNIAAQKAKVEESEEQTIDDTKKAVFKIWDHVNLACNQYEDLKQSDAEYDEKFEQRITKFQNKLTSEMNAQLLSMVGIFTALSFILFGGINSLESVFSALDAEDIVKLMILACVWGLGMLNVIFIFLFCVGKMTGLNFKSSQNPRASFWQKYPVVCWTNYLLIFLLIGLMWLEFCLKKGIGTWLSDKMVGYPVYWSVGVTLILIIVFIMCFCGMVKLTMPSSDKKEEKSKPI